MATVAQVESTPEELSLLLQKRDGEVVVRLHGVGGVRVAGVLHGGRVVCYICVVCDGCVVYVGCVVCVVCVVCVFGIVCVVCVFGIDCVVCVYGIVCVVCVFGIVCVVCVVFVVCHVRMPAVSRQCCGSLFYIPSPILHYLTYFTFPHLFYIPSPILHSLSLLPSPFTFPLSPILHSLTPPSPPDPIQPPLSVWRKGCLCMLLICLPNCLLMSQVSPHSSQLPTLPVLALHVFTQMSAAVTTFPTLLTRSFTARSSCA